MVGDLKWKNRGGVMLPKSKNKEGYTIEEIKTICRKRKISLSKFNKAFDINTCTLKDGVVIYYKCDVEKALNILKHKDGRYHLWD